MPERTPAPTNRERDNESGRANRERDNESGRVSRSGTSAGIAVDNESTSGGSGPIPPGGNAPLPREELERERHKH